MSQVPQETFVC